MPGEESLVGTVLELEVGAAAHGGSCVARVDDGRVVFVRHALPGELVRAVVTEDEGGSYLRADALEVLRPHTGRVTPPCRYAGPGLCGGCDWQHAAGSLQRQLKAEIVLEQFQRIADLDVSDLLHGVEELPGGLLGWRTRITYATGPDGRLGLHKHRSSDVQVVDRCLIGVDGVGDSQVLTDSWADSRPVTGVEVVRGVDGVVTVLEHRPGPGRHARGRRPPDRATVVDGPPLVEVAVAGHPMTVSAGGFWQVHPAAADVYATTVLEFLGPRPGESVLELFSGAGALTVVLADAVGTTGRVVAIESSPVAVADAEANLSGMTQVDVQRGRVDPDLIEAAPLTDLVVVDPPRAGLGAEAIRRIVNRSPRAVAYVSCDPATLARDVRAAVEAGWRLAALRAFDAFPMTAHIECIALLAPGHE